jgi:hypothetical protein
MGRDPVRFVFDPGTALHGYDEIGATSQMRPDVEELAAEFIAKHNAEASEFNRAIQARQPTTVAARK